MQGSFAQRGKRHRMFKSPRRREGAQSVWLSLHDCWLPGSLSASGLQSCTVGLSMRRFALLPP